MARKRLYQFTLETGARITIDARSKVEAETRYDAIIRDKRAELGLPAKGKGSVKARNMINRARDDWHIRAAFIPIIVLRAPMMLLNSTFDKE